MTKAIEPSPLPGKVSGFPLAVDDLLIMETSGGGGYGDPLAREASRVALDVAEGGVSRADAEARYGVVFHGDTVDENATRERRRALNAARIHVELHPTDALDETRVSGIILAPAVAVRLGARVGAVLELVDPQGAPLRLWLAAIAQSDGERAFVSAATLQMLGLAPGTRAEIRALLPPPEADAEVKELA